MMNEDGMMNVFSLENCQKMCKIPFYNNPRPEWIKYIKPASDATHQTSRWGLAVRAPAELLRQLVADGVGADAERALHPRLPPPTGHPTGLIPAVPGFPRQVLQPQQR